MIFVPYLWSSSGRAKYFLRDVLISPSRFGQTVESPKSKSTQPRSNICCVTLYFQPGDWMFINLPVISKFEWHPFTISSAPERRDDVLTFHIRSVGGWTNKLHEYFVEENRLIEDERLGRRVAEERKSMIPRYTLITHTGWGISWRNCFGLT